MGNSIWVDEGNDADLLRLLAAGITEVYFSMKDPRVTLAYLEGVASQKGVTGVGVYVASNWYPSLSGSTFASTLSHEFAALFPGTAPDFPKVCVNIETHDIAGYVLPFLKRWRQLRALRVTSWALEGHQGGLFAGHTDWVQAVLMANVELLPELYNGAMSEVWDSLAMARDLQAVGFPLERVSPFYDAAHLPDYWQGFAFTQGRLP